MFFAFLLTKCAFLFAFHFKGNNIGAHAKW